jgi:hypothetical protein
LVRDIASITLVVRLDDDRIWRYEFDGRTSDLEVVETMTREEGDLRRYDPAARIIQSPINVEVAISAKPRLDPRRIEGMPPYDGPLGVAVTIHTPEASGPPWIVPRVPVDPEVGGGLTPMEARLLAAKYLAAADAADPPDA